MKHTHNPPRLQAHRSRHTAEADHNAWLSSITSPLALFPTPRSEGRGPSRSRPCHPRATKILQSAPQTQALRNVKRFAQQAVGMGMGMGVEIETGMEGSFASPCGLLYPFMPVACISTGTGTGITGTRHSARERGGERELRVSQAFSDGVALFLPWDAFNVVALVVMSVRLRRESLSELKDSVVSSPLPALRRAHPSNLRRSVEAAQKRYAGTCMARAAATAAKM